MRSWDGYRIRWTLVGLVIVTVLGGGRYVRADFTFGEPTNLGLTVNSSAEDGGPSISADGLSLYFYDFLKGMGNGTLNIATRETIEAPWEHAISFDPPYNYGAAPCISVDELSIYMDASGDGGSDIFVAKRSAVSDSWSEPANLGAGVNSSFLDMGASITADGLSLFFGSNRSGGSGDWDIYVTTRETVSDPWSTAVNLGPTVNCSAYDGHPCISSDGLTLFITSARSGGYGDWDIWMTRRTRRNGDWETPLNLGPNVNTTAGEGEPSLSADGRTLYFSDWMNPRPGGVGKVDLWQVPILLVVDFNGDAIVDVKDIVVLTEHWGENYPLCDIGPTPLGDGIVDVQDLKVLLEYIEPIDRTLMAHWTLNEAEGDVAYDSAAENDAVVMGAALWQSEGGQVDGALQFDGVDDYLAAPFILDPVKQAFSVFVWIKGGQPGQTIISQQGAFGAWLSVDPVGTLSTGLTFPLPPVTSSIVIADNHWHHIGLVSDGSGMSLYVDSEEVARSDISPILPASGDLQIGAGKNLESGTFWSGMIDDVRIYDRVVEP
jgi:hypothetical protein